MTPTELLELLENVEDTVEMNSLPNVDDQATVLYHLRQALYVYERYALALAE